MTTTGTDVVQAYLAAWNETGPTARRAAIEAAFAPDARHVDPIADPLADGSGADAMDELIAGTQQRFPGMRFRPVGDVEAHHDGCRFRPCGRRAARDRLRRRVDGRRRPDLHVHGFLDRVPARA
jgi:SnoaL-like domain